MRGGSASCPSSAVLPAQAQNSSKFTSSSSDSNIQDTIELLDGSTVYIISLFTLVSSLKKSDRVFFFVFYHGHVGSPSVRLSVPFGEVDSGGSVGGAGNPTSSTAITTGRPAVAAAPSAAPTSGASTAASSSGSADSADGGDVADEIISW